MRPKLSILKNSPETKGNTRGCHEMSRDVTRSLKMSRDDKRCQDMSRYFKEWRNMTREVGRCQEMSRDD